MAPRGVIRTVGRGAGLRAFAVREDGARMEVEHAPKTADGVAWGKENEPQQPNVPLKQLQVAAKQSEKTVQVVAASSTTMCAQRNDKITAGNNSHSSSGTVGTRRDPASAVRTLRGNRRKRTRFTPVLAVIYEDAVLV
jgi:hypothetical protein